MSNYNSGLTTKKYTILLVVNSKYTIFLVVNPLSTQIQRPAQKTTEKLIHKFIHSEPFNYNYLIIELSSTLI